MEEIQPLSSPVKQWVLDEPAMSCFHCFISKKKKCLHWIWFVEERDYTRKGFKSGWWNFL